MSDHLASLQQAFTGPPGPHLDDDRLAEIVSVEAAGEDIDALFVLELQHIESCVQCAEAYGGLVEMMLAAVADMTASAQVVTPLDVYTKLLTYQVENQIVETADLTQFIRSVADALPLLFTRLPTMATEMDLAKLVAAIARMTNIPSDLLETVAQAIRHNLSSLSAYLTGVAAITWGQNLDVKAGTSDAGHLLQLRRGPAIVVPSLSGHEMDDKWSVLERRIGHPLPLHVAAYAERLSTLACRLVVRVDRPGLQRAEGRAVQLVYGSQSETAVTDEYGMVTFASVPIAALSKLDLIIEED